MNEKETIGVIVISDRGEIEGNGGEHNPIFPLTGAAVQYGHMQRGGQL